MKQYETGEKCAECGKPMKKTEPVTHGRGPSYEGYVCHDDRRVTWVRVT